MTIGKVITFMIAAGAVVTACIGVFAYKRISMQ